MAKLFSGGMKRALIALLFVISGCSEDDTSRQLGEVVKNELVPAALSSLREDRQTHARLLGEIVDRVRPGFSEQDKAKRAKEMGHALRLLRGIGKYSLSGLMSATMSTLVATDEKGVVFATHHAKPHWSLAKDLPVADAKGQPLLYAVKAEDGSRGFVGFFEVHPVENEGKLLGYIGGLTPLPRIAAKITRELSLSRADHISAGGTIWAALLHEGSSYGDGNHSLLPGKRLPSAEREKRYSTSSGGFIDVQRIYKKPMAIGYLRLPSFADGLELALFYGEEDEQKSE